MSTDKGDGEQDFGGPLSNLQVRGHRSEVGDREQGDRDSKICHLGGWQVRGSCNVFQPSMKNYRAFPEARVLALGPHGMWAVAVQRQDLKERAFRLASRVFKLFPELASTGLAHAYLARQLLSATASVGANLEEGVAASSRRDMASKYSIALRESRPDAKRVESRRQAAPKPPHSTSPARVVKTRLTLQLAAPAPYL